MFREIEPLGGTAGPTAVAAPLRHPDGTINFDAYRERARRARSGGHQVLGHGSVLADRQSVHRRMTGGAPVRMRAPP